MRILSIISKIPNVQPFVVFNDQLRSGGIPDKGFDLLSTPVIYQADQWRSANKFTQPRFNSVDTWNFTVTYTFSGAVPTLKFIAGLRGNVPFNGELQYQVSDNSGSIVLYCPNVIRGPLGAKDRIGSVDLNWAFTLNANWTTTP